MRYCHPHRRQLCRNRYSVYFGLGACIADLAALVLLPIDLKVVCDIMQIYKQRLDHAIMKNYYVYKHTSPTGKVYIGITQQSPTKRWGGGANYDYNTHFINAIKKYGWDGFTHEILFEGLTRDEAIEKEIELIKQYESDNRSKGYNISPGGSAPGKETAKKIREARVRNRIGEKESDRMKRQWADSEYRERVIQNMRGKTRSDESKERYRAAMLRRGKPKRESIEKMRKSLQLKVGEYSIRKRPVLQIAPVTLKIVARHWTAREAAASVNASINCIAGACRRKSPEIKASKGYFWCYEDEYDSEYFEQYRGIPFTKSGRFPRMGERTSGHNRVWTAEQRASIGQKHSRSIVCVETGEVFPSIRAAEDKYGGNGGISRCLSGKSKTSRGFHWRYAEESE